MMIKYFFAPIFVFSIASQAQAGPLLESVKGNDFPSVKTILDRDQAASGEIGEALDWANARSTSDPALDRRILILLTVAKSLEPFKHEGKRSGPPAHALDVPLEIKEVANCYGTALFFYNIMPVLKFVEEVEFNFIAESPLCRDLGENFDNRHRPPIGSIGFKEGSHAFIYIGSDLAFQKPDPYTPWEISNVKALPYCKGRPFEAYHFIECSSMDGYIKAMGTEHSEEVQAYREVDGELQLLEELARNYEKGKNSRMDFPDHDASFYAPLNKFVAAIEARAQAGLQSGQQEAREDGKGASSSALPKKTGPSAFLWSSLLNRLQTLKGRPLFKKVWHPER